MANLRKRMPVHERNVAPIIAQICARKKQRWVPLAPGMTVCCHSQQLQIKSSSATDAQSHSLLDLSIFWPHRDSQLSCDHLLILAARFTALPDDDMFNTCKRLHL